MGAFDRDGYTTLTLPLGTPGPANGSLIAGTAANPYPNVVLDILVSAVGRQNSRTTYDTKGLSSPDVLLNGAAAQASQASAAAFGEPSFCTTVRSVPSSLACTWERATVMEGRARTQAVRRCGWPVGLVSLSSSDAAFPLVQKHSAGMVHA